MARLVVLGSVNMDLVAKVPHLPRPGETVLGESLSQFPGGKGANQAVAAARLGAEVALVGRVGDDAHGSALIEHLAREPINVLLVERAPHSLSGVAIVLVDSDGQNMITVIPGSNASVGEADVGKAIGALAHSDLLLLQLEIAYETVRSAIDQARAIGARTVLNAAPAPNINADLWNRVDVCVLNANEASSVVGRPVNGPTDAGECVLELHDRGIGLPVVTLGKDGAVFFDAGRSSHLGPPIVKVVDSTGAGDAFVGALCAALLAGCAPAGAVSLANAAGAATTQKSGAQTALPYRSDLKRLFGLDWPTRDVSASAREIAGERVVPKGST